MDLTLVTYGSEGDTRPFVGLALALKSAGHTLHMFAEQSAAHNAVSAGLPVSILSGNIKETLPLQNPRNELRGADVLRAIKRGMDVVKNNTAAWMSAIAERAAASDAVLFSGLATPAATAVAAGLGKPAISLWLQPTTPTREFAAPTVPWTGLPGTLNRLSYRLGPEATMYRLFGRRAQESFVQQFGRQESFRRAVCLRLYGFSAHLVPRPADWTDNNVICGSWSQPAVGWDPPAALLEFLAHGEAPIYVGFGAVASFVRQKGLNTIVEALDGRRAVFYPGWSHIDQDMLPANVHVIGDTPHRWLFPRMSCLLHHAGAGTTHAAVESGIPSVALPIGADQPFWAQRLYRAGVAPKPLSGIRLDASELSQRIRHAESAPVRAMSRLMAQRLASEQGLKVAVELIERHATAQIR